MQQKIEQALMKHQERIESTGLFFRMFTPTEDILFLRWWLALTESNEIASIIIPDNYRLVNFLSTFEAPRVTCYSLSDSGDLNYVFWLSDPRPDDSTISASIWAHQDLRAGEKEMAKLFTLASLSHDLAFEFYDNLLAITWQDKMLKLVTKIGYNVIGVIPNYFGQKEVFMLHLKKEEFQNSRFHNL